MRKGGHNA